MFLNPMMLAGIAAAAVPLVIHLLWRSRFRSVDWGAMMFLEQRGAADRAARLKGPVLLILRMGMVGLLAAALAQPVLHGLGGDARDRHISAAIILDASASMAMDENGRSRFDLAKEAVYHILGGVGAGLRQKGDTVSLIVAGEAESAAESSPRPNVAEQSDPAQAISAALQGLVGPGGQADIAAALNRALDELEKSANPRREIYLVCDRQAASWKNVDAAFAAAFRRRIAAWPLPPAVFVIPIGSDSTDNLAVEDVQLAEAPAVVGQAAQIEVRLHNYSPIPRAGLALSVGINYGPSYSPHKTPLAGRIGGRETALVRLPVTFTEAGSHLIVAEVERGPGVRFAQRKDQSVEVLEVHHVLMVSGDWREHGYRAAADFLRLALNPFAAPRRQPVRLEVISDAHWPADDLADYQVVILANVAEISAAQARAIQAFVFDGGGLLIVPGDLTQTDNYNASLGPEGADLLPGNLGAELTGAESAPTALTKFDAAHPVLAFLRGKSEPDPVAVQRYFPVAPYAGSLSAAWLANGRPFLLQTSTAHTGRGRVLMVAASLDADSTALPATSLFLPMMQSAVHYLSGGAAQQRSVIPGWPLTLAPNGPVDDKSVALRRLISGGSLVEQTKPQILGRASGVELFVPPPDEPGTYIAWAIVRKARGLSWKAPPMPAIRRR